jgi:hypothetical protein
MIQQQEVSMTAFSVAGPLEPATQAFIDSLAGPIAAMVVNAQAALHWLDRQPPDLEEVRQALASVVKDGVRARDVIDRIRALIKKPPPRKDHLEINGVIHEVIELTRGEAVKNGVSVRTKLADGLPIIQGDRVHLQQVILNLIINAVEAMSAVNEGTRELLISTSKAEPGVLVAVRDSGPGLAPATLEQHGGTFGLAHNRYLAAPFFNSLWSRGGISHEASLGGRADLVHPRRPQPTTPDHGCPSRKSYPRVAMMQSEQNWRGNNGS